MKNKQLSNLEIAKLQSDLFQSRNEIIRLEKNLINKTNISNQLKNSLAESFERELKLKAERDALAVKVTKLEKKITAINDGIAEYKAMANDATADLVHKALMDVREEIIQRDLYQSAPDFIEKFANEYVERVKRGEQ